ncbi:hypothetical protein ACTFIZ_004683 [Dictyostelium cf. discoideum]
MKIILLLLFLISLNLNLNFSLGKDLQKQNSSPAVFSNDNHSGKFQIPWFLFSNPIEYETFANEVILNVQKVIIENNKNDTNGICSKGVLQMMNYVKTQGNGHFSISLFVSSMKQLSSMCGMDGIYSNITNSISEFLKNGFNIADLEPVGDLSKIFYCFGNTIYYYGDKSQHAQELGKCIGSQIIGVQYL